MTAEEIKKWYEESGKKELNILYAELQDLAVKIKIWAIIAETSKNGVLVQDAFWGWLQKDCIFRSAVVDGLKLKDDFFKRLSEIIQRALSREQYGKLRKACFRKGIGEDFEACIGHLRLLRNNLIAHLDSESLVRVSLDLGDLLLILADLFCGLSTTLFYLGNPDWIIQDEWNLSSIPETKEKRLSTFNNLFEMHPSIRDCTEILKFLEKQKECF